eukprot:1908843-Prymnesium_polylepis.1
MFGLPYQPHRSIEERLCPQELHQGRRPMLDAKSFIKAGGRYFKPAEGPGGMKQKVEGTLRLEGTGEKAKNGTLGFGMARKLQDTADPRTNERPQTTPGPAAYSAAASLGPRQPTRKSSAAFGFGSASRHLTPSEVKAYISEDHARQGGGAHTPAPGAYNAASTLGPQQSARPSSASYAFGKAARTPCETKLYLSEELAAQTARGAHTPGAGQYEAATTLGPNLCTRHSFASYGFGTRPRSAGLREWLSGPSPGPGDYFLADATGRQPSSMHRSPPAFGFGTDERSIRAQREDERNAASPGPGAYNA